MLLKVYILLSVLSVASERIVTLSPAINEIVYALGAGDKIVGNTLYSTYPPRSALVSKVGGFFNPNIEKILILNPDIVIMQKNNQKLAKQLQRLGIQTKTIYINRLSHISEAILQIGELVAKVPKAQEIIKNIKQHLEDIQHIIRHKKILMVMGHNTELIKNIFVVGKDLYLNDIITLSGNTNAMVSTRKGQPIFNQENLIASNPDIVILLAHSMHQKGLSASELLHPWQDLPISAVKHQNIYIIDKEYSGIPSDRLILFLQDFKKILYASKNH
ncbi:MAG: helical backbone metal receptor [Sulfurovum sp.]|nr:helical backbone metal receptor [Sulfurovum sp.]